MKCTRDSRLLPILLSLSRIKEGRWSVNQSKINKREEEANQDKGARRSQMRPMNESKNKEQEQEAIASPRCKRKKSE